MTIEHIHDGQHDPNELAGRIALKVKQARKAIEESKIESWLKGNPPWIVRLAIDQAIADGSIIRYICGPRLRERVYLVDPKKFTEPTIHFLQASPEVAKKLAGHYVLTSRAKEQAERAEAAQAEAERKEKARIESERQHALHLEIEAAQTVEEIEADWVKPEAELRKALALRANNHVGKDEVERRLAMIPGTLAVRKRHYVENEFLKRLNRPIDEALLDEVAPLPGQAEPA